MLNFIKYALLSLGFLLLSISPSFSGETGHYTPGVDFFENGTLPPPGGPYMKNYLLNYSSDSYRDKNGNKVGSSFKVNTTLLVNRFLYVTEQKIFGADWGLHAIVPIGYSSVTAPNGKKSSTDGLGDIFVEPLLLGWHGDRWDAMVGFGMYLPTGQYSKNKVSNLGKDFYTGMLSTGLTYYFDEERTWKAGGRVRYEVHSTNDRLDIRHGDDLTLEFSASKAFFPYLEVGVAGYGQWQVSKDSGSDVYWDKGVKDSIYGFGPEIKFNIPQINGSITLNYIREFDAQDRAQGQIFGASLSLAF